MHTPPNAAPPRDHDSPADIPAAPAHRVAIVPRWRRRDFEASDSALQRLTIGWMKSLPDAVKPLRAARHHPRLVNEVAALWSLNERCIEWLDELLEDRRGDRQGFSHGIEAELRRLRMHCVARRPGKAQRASDTDFPPTSPMAL